jgi:hypothetical protein
MDERLCTPENSQALRSEALFNDNRDYLRLAALPGYIDPRDQATIIAHKEMTMTTAKSTSFSLRLT